MSCIETVTGMMVSFINEQAFPSQQSCCPFGNYAPNRAGADDKQVWIFHSQEIETIGGKGKALA
jgi:hypothetical protein